MARTVAAVATALLVVVLAGCAGAPEAAPVDDAPDGSVVIVPGRPGEPARTMSADDAVRLVPPNVASPADVTFLSMMIPHHEQALHMSGLAPQRADDAQVRAIADRIAAAQGPEIDVMRAWLEREAPEAAPVPGAHGGHAGHGADMPGMQGMASLAQLDALADARGPAFDRMFLDLMIAHHEGAIGMARQAQVGGTDIDAQRIADDVIVSQSAEIGRMRALLPAG